MISLDQIKMLVSKITCKQLWKYIMTILNYLSYDIHKNSYIIIQNRNFAKPEINKD